MILLVYLQVVFTFLSVFSPILVDWASVNFVGVYNRYEDELSNRLWPEKPGIQPDLPGPRPQTARQRSGQNPPAYPAPARARLGSEAAGLAGATRSHKFKIFTTDKTAPMDFASGALFYNRLCNDHQLQKCVKNDGKTNKPSRF
jgi:hypothetical protein